MCWPANIAGSFFIGLLIFDIIQKEYTSLTRHGLIGVCVTGLLWVLCLLIGPSITMGVLVVPLIFVGIFLFTVWFTNESMKTRGCCMTCGKVKPDKPKCNSKPPPPPPPPKTCITGLSSTPNNSFPPKPPPPPKEKCGC